MSTNLYEETIDEEHRKTSKDTKLQRKTRMTTVNSEELTNDSNEWTNDNIGWRRTED
jgi:hypothetical protein